VRLTHAQQGAAQDLEVQKVLAMTRCILVLQQYEGTIMTRNSHILVLHQITVQRSLMNVLDCRAFAA
jgi:hypothetical protein